MLTNKSFILSQLHVYNVLSILYAKKRVNCLFVLLTGQCFYSGPGLFYEVPQ